MPYDRTDRMSAAELDAYVAEREKPENLPKWWFSAAEKRGPTRAKRVKTRRVGQVRKLADPRPLRHR